MTISTKPNTGFWIIAVIALLWNLMGAFTYISTTFMAQEYSEAEMALMNDIPSWYNIVFAIAVFAGVIGSLVMLMRKKFAVTLFLISLIAVLIIQSYWLFATDAMDVMGAQAVVMPMIVIVVAIFLYFYSKGAAQKHWLT